jgi:hypothetical protein
MSRHLIMRHASLVTTNRIHLHQAKGVAVLTETHVSQNEHRAGLESLTVFCWRDERGVEGQDTTARLVNYLSDHADMLAVEVDGALVPVDVSSDRRTLMTRGADSESDPLLGLPRFNVD